MGVTFKWPLRAGGPYREVAFKTGQTVLFDE